MNLSEEQILALAPDDASKKAGKGIASPANWVSKGADANAIWGECQGSGSKPYQTSVDVANIAFKCSCPSRKFPCKHGLGVLLYYVRKQSDFTVNEQPPWVKDWIEKRIGKSEKKAETADKPVDAEAQAKRQQARIKKVNDGIGEMLLWIKDIVRNGIVDIPGKGNQFFENMGKRMVDAQSPGLAAMVNSMENINFYKEGWESKFLDKLLNIYLLIQGYKNIDGIDAGMQQEIRALIGFPQSQDEIRARDGVKDDWYVLGKQVTQEDQLTIERNWLLGAKTRKYALVIQFYVKNQLKEIALAPGIIMEAELVFYNDALPMRALVKTQAANKPASAPPPVAFKNWTEALEAQTSINSINPFNTELPFVLEKVRPVFHNAQWWLQDADNDMMGMKLPQDIIWKLLAISGGQYVPISVVGKENEYVPLGVWSRSEYRIL